MFELRRPQSLWTEVKAKNEKNDNNTQTTDDWMQKAEAIMSEQLTAPILWPGCRNGTTWSNRMLHSGGAYEQNDCIHIVRTERNSNKCIIQHTHTCSCSWIWRLTSGIYGCNMTERRQTTFAHTPRRLPARALCEKDVYICSMNIITVAKFSTLEHAAPSL